MSDALKLVTIKQMKEIFIPRLIHYIDKKTANGDDFITEAEIQRILNGTYSPVDDDNPITDTEIEAILNGTYEPVEDDDFLTADDFVF